MLDKIESDLKPQKTYIYTQNGITNLTPEWLEHPLVKEEKAEIYLCNYRDNEYLQPLHAKSIAIQTNDKCLLAFGSANFSSPALLRTIKSGNAEILIRLPGLTTEEFDPERFFDPESSAVRLVTPTKLQNSKSDEEEIVEERKHFEIKLKEATFNEDTKKIIIKAEIPITYRFGEVKCNLTFHNQLDQQFNINYSEEHIYFVSIPPITERRLNEGSATIQIEAFDKENQSVRSNILLVTNLKDPKTDKPVRKERHLKEAQQNAEQFLAVLKDLIDSNDNEALLAFLNHCNIPLQDFVGRSFFREAKPVWDGGAGMRVLGEKNLKIYTELHPAVIAFFDRHFKRLQRQVVSLNINGVENFLQLFLGMGDVLRSQVERAVLGLEAKKSLVTTEEWSNCRKYIDIYFGKFKQLMECLWREYLTEMIKEYRRADISEKFLPDFQRVTDLCADMLSYQERVEKFRVTYLKRVNERGQVVISGYFHCVLSPESWGKYVKEVNEDLTKIRETIIFAA